MWENPPTSEPTVDEYYGLVFHYDPATRTFKSRLDDSRWSIVRKTADEPRSSDATLADDLTLKFSMEANKCYTFRGYLPFTTGSTADFKFDFDGPTATSIVITGIDGNGNHFKSNAYNDAKSVDVSSDSSYTLKFEGTVHNGPDAGDFVFRWAQNTSDATDTVVGAGGYIEYMKVPVLMAYRLIAATGYYTLTGGDAFFNISRSFAADCGVFTITGQSANFSAVRTLVAGNGSFTISGQSANIYAVRTLVAGNGSFTITGQSANFTLVSPLLLDTYSGAAAAYSVRKVNSSYSGYCLRIRRSSDNTELDIGFSGNYIDESAITSFVGSGSAYVVKWYDQSGNGNDAVQSTTSKQPLIVSSGTVQKVNGKVAMYFDGSDDFLSLTSAITTAYSYHNFNVNKRTGSGVRGLLFCGTSFLPYTAFRNNDNFMYASGDAGYLTSSASSSSSNQELLTTKYVSGSENMYANGTVVSSSFTSFPQLSDITNIGGKDTAGQYSTAYAQEIIHYSSDQSSNQTAIESNIKTYFGL